MTTDAAPDSNQPDQGIQAKVVPERDLLAVKENLNRTRAELNESKRLADEHYQNLLVERASREEAQGKLQGMESLQEKLTQLETSLAGERTSREQAENRLLDARRKELVNTYGIPASAVDGKNQRELEVLEETARLLGVSKKRSGIDNTGGGGATTGNMSARDKITAGFDELYKR